MSWGTPQSCWVAGLKWKWWSITSCGWYFSCRTHCHQPLEACHSNGFQEKSAPSGKRCLPELLATEMLTPSHGVLQEPRCFHGNIGAHAPASSSIPLNIPPATSRGTWSDPVMLLRYKDCSAQIRKVTLSTTITALHYMCTELGVARMWGHSEINMEIEMSLSKTMYQHKRGFPGVSLAVVLSLRELVLYDARTGKWIL